MALNPIYIYQSILAKFASHFTHPKEQLTNSLEIHRACFHAMGSLSSLGKATELLVTASTWILESL
jgi:hypothetical protein